jgi:glycosyltransferase involved in cell wall biosynthesis
MKVVYITTVAESLRFLRGHVRFLRSRGVDVTLVSSPSPLLESIANELGASAHGVRMERRITPLRDLIAIWQLIRCFRRLRPDVVHVHTPKAGLLGLVAASLSGVPVRLYHIHGLPLLTARRIKRRVLSLCDSIACRLAHQVFCVSYSIKSVVHQERICSSAKTQVLVNGTIDGIDAIHQFNPSRFSAEDRLELRKSIGLEERDLIVGRIVKEKGIDELLAAFKRLSIEWNHLRLLVVGSQESHLPLSAKSMAMFHEDVRIHTLPFVEDPAPYFAVMDVLALPTYREGFGLVAAEAAAMEVPVVATRIPGCVDAVCDGQTGTLVPPRDSSALAAALAHYLRSIELRRSHGLAGRMRVLRDFDPELLRKSLYQNYLRISEQNRSRGRSFGTAHRAAKKTNNASLENRPRQDKCHVNVAIPARLDP